MIDHLQTLYKSVLSQLTELRKHANWNKTEMKHIMLMIILNDLIEWSNSITEADPKWNKVMDEYMLNHPEFLVVRTLTPYFDKLYTNVNTPQSDEFWDRIWDHQDAILIRTVDSSDTNDYIYVNTVDGWVKKEIANNQVTLEPSITGSMTDIDFTIPTNYTIVSAVNGSLLEDDLMDDITTREEEGNIIYTFDFAAPLNEPIIITFKHE